MFIYRVVPMDFGWDLLLTVEEHLARVAKEEEELGDRSGAGAANFRKFYEKALEQARKSGWEGDFRQGPAVFAIPDGQTGVTVGIVWKQDNNGDTFIASDVRLPHLEQ